MMTLFRWLLGIEPTQWAEGGGWGIELLVSPGGDTVFLLIVLACAIVAGLYWLYRIEARRLPASRRLLMMGLRVVVIGLIALMLLEPVFVLRKVEPMQSHLIVLMDVSESMALRDAWEDPKAAQAAADALGLSSVDAIREATRQELGQRAMDHHLIAALEAGGDRLLRFHPFTDQLEPTPVPPAAPLQAPPTLANPAETSPDADAPPLAPSDTGNGTATPVGNPASTAIGSAIRQALLAYRGKPIAGILLLTDGQSNTGPSPLVAAQLAMEEGIPIAALAIGTDTGPRNLAIRQLEIDPVVFVRDTNRITAFVESRGMAGQTVNLLLEQRREGGDWEEFERRELTIAADGRLQPITFDFAEEQPTRLEFRASLVDPGPQLTTDDDVQLAQTRVIRQKLRVLVIAGSTFPEIQFMRNTLLRDQSIELASWLQSADKQYRQPGDNPITRLPTTAQELDQFDCIIMYDPDPDQLPPGFAQLVVDFVARSGGGLVYIAGEFYTSANFDRQGDPSTAFMNILPVIREPGLFRSAVQLRLSRENPWTLDITDAGRRDAIFMFEANPEANQQVLSALPGMYWHFAVTRAKPGATILAQHGDARMRNQFGPEVLLATQLVGPGRTFFLGFDSTYRWRYLDESYFDGFWARVADRAGRSKQLGGVYPFRLSTDQATYQPGSEVNINARFTDPQQVDPSLTALYAEVERAGDEPQPLTLLPEGEGNFTASTTVLRAGPHTVRVWAGDESAKVLGRPAITRFDVALPNLEYQNPTLDLATLRALTALTGGQALTLDRCAELPGLFKVRTVDRVLEDRQEIWDAPLLWGLLLIALIGEWVTRKKYRLI